MLRAVAGSSAAVLGALAVALFLLLLTLARDAALPARNRYGLVFDAGSTHTSLYIYRWPAGKENGTGIVSQVEACSVQGPGISSYADNPAGAGASLKPCLDKAMEVVPAEQQQETPTYLGATAGMRLLREQNSSKAEQVLAEVAKAIGQYPVDFRGARILTGNEEGSFGWVTVNYLLETLIKWSFTGTWSHPPAEDVVGALDLGGASAQITFLPGTPLSDSSTRALLRLYGTNYSIYTHSYLCYGLQQALKMLLASLPQGNSSSPQISHPCYPRGYQENTTTAELYDSPCVQAPSTASPAESLTVTGTGDPAACSAAIEDLFNFSCGANQSCGFNGVYQPPVRGAFFVQEKFPTASSRQRRDACAASSYTLALLLHGYSFDRSSWPHIHFVQQVANADVGWTLGYMLNLTNMIPSEAPQRVVGLQRSSWVAATVLLTIILILTFCLLTAVCCQKGSSGYERL
ncbi:ectonucleoside triphosphate diphosphohydrolase 8-like isoform X2 [Pogoniulus pusillus]|uniref:ectonucleoside triphosphate diphosphohydrolase 8-like isoform X2 n=1 Tax=Pogoniulus pusillus TaxID=488313 RepID=UPI0030B982FE